TRFKCDWSSDVCSSDLTITNQDGTVQQLGTTGRVQGPAFKTNIPEILDYTRIFGMHGINITNNNRSFAVNVLYVDENFFNLFSFPLLNGNSNTALKEPYSMVLSESAALKFFGTTDVVGKILKLEEGNGIENLAITGIAKDAPVNSSIQFEILIPFKYLQTMFLDKNWLNQYLTTFILLHPATNPKIVEQKFSKVFETNASEQLHQANMTPDQFKFWL